MLYHMIKKRKKKNIIPYDTILYNITSYDIISYHIVYTLSSTGGSTISSVTLMTCGQSPYYDSGFQKVWLEQNLDFKEWNSHVHRGFPGKFESSNPNRDNVSREMGRIQGVAEQAPALARKSRRTPPDASLRTTILDFGGFDPSRILILRGGMLVSIGNSPESLNQRILAGIILVGRLGVIRLVWVSPCAPTGDLRRGESLRAFLQAGLRRTYTTPATNSSRQKNKKYSIPKEIRFATPS